MKAVTAQAKILKKEGVKFVTGFPIKGDVGSKTTCDNAIDQGFSVAQPKWIGLTQGWGSHLA